MFKQIPNLEIWKTPTSSGFSCATGLREIKKDLLKNPIENKDRVVVALQGTTTNKSVVKNESKREELTRSLLEVTPSLDWVVRSRTTADDLGAKIYYVGRVYKNREENKKL